MLQGSLTLLTKLGLRQAPYQPCYRGAYDETMAKSAVGLMQTAIPYYGKMLIVDVDKGLVRLGFDPATVKTAPSMTIGPGGKMTHRNDIDEQECIHLATILWAVAAGNSIRL